MSASAALLSIEVLDYDFMRRALVAAVLVGLAAPATGVFLVQRRLALIGDGLGHVAVTGVALGLVLDRAPVFVALITAVIGAVVLELIRSRREAVAEMALAILFYGGIAGGVVLVSRAPAGGRSLNQYLFGSITTTSTSDLVTFGVLAVVVMTVTVALGPALFTVSSDEEFARASGLPVVPLNLTLAVLSALTVVISMRVVGVLLVSALMVVPVAAAQLVTRSFRSTYLAGILVGAVVSVSGVVASYYLDTPPGGTIVLFAIGLFAVTLIAQALVRALR
ncbi:MAG: metal ABC transporter permease [Actinomycetota bacterium]|nr:metal ABC transporter permease [Actinomycetota bacterium]